MDFQLFLDSETVTRAHPTEPLAVGPGTSVREVLDRLKAANRGAAVVCAADGKLVGIFTERDFVRLAASGGHHDRPIETVMVRDPVTLVADDTVGTAISTMSAGGYRHLPIVDDQGRPTGMLEVSGIIHYMVEHFPAVIYTLPPQPHHSMQEREGA